MMLYVVSVAMANGNGFGYSLNGLNVNLQFEKNEFWSKVVKTSLNS